jgi:hypothetical protein
MDRTVSFVELGRTVFLLRVLEGGAAFGQNDCGCLSLLSRLQPGCLARLAKGEPALRREQALGDDNVGVLECVEMGF